MGAGGVCEWDFAAVVELALVPDGLARWGVVGFFGPAVVVGGTVPVGVGFVAPAPVAGGEGRVGGCGWPGLGGWGGLG